MHRPSQIAFSPYTLRGKGPFKDREGALIRVHFNDGSIGYADCHPWHELGDLPLREELEQFSRTILTKRTLFFAALDGKARANNKKLFANRQIPPSHWLLYDQTIPEAFTHVKVKVGPETNIEQLFAQIPKHLKVRIDCNRKFTRATLPDFLPYRDRIDFIEDPIDDWGQMGAYKIPLACDRDSDRLPEMDVTILKPAVQGFIRRKRLVVTSYLDHPLGQLSAAYIATQLPVEVCGLCSHHVYETTPFSEQLGRTSYLQPPEGTGFGFDVLLKKQKWVDL